MTFNRRWGGWTSLHRKRRHVGYCIRGCQGYSSNDWFVLLGIHPRGHSSLGSFILRPSSHGEYSQGHSSQGDLSQGVFITRCNHPTGHSSHGVSSLGGFILDQFKFSDFFEFDENTITRGYNLKLIIPRTKTNCRQRFFAVRIVPVWNSLPRDLVNCRCRSKLKMILNDIICLNS